MIRPTFVFLKGHSQVDTLKGADKSYVGFIFSTCVEQNSLLTFSEDLPRKSKNTQPMQGARRTHSQARAALWGVTLPRQML